MAALVFWRTPCGGDDDAERDTCWIKLQKRVKGVGAYETVDDRIPLLDKSDNFITSYNDPAGVAEGESGEHEYRASFLNRTGGEIPDSETEGIAGVAPATITPTDVRSFIENLDTGETTDRWINDRILEAQAYIESRVRSKLVLTTEADERQDGTGGPLIHLFKRPLVEVQLLELKFPFAGFQRDIPHEWLILDKKHSLVRIIPPAHEAFLILSAATAFPTHYNLTLYPPLPHVVRCTYTHGYSPLPADLKQAWLKQAAIESLQVIGDAKGGGIASKSVDGVSESYTASATTHIYSARIKWYQDDIERIMIRYEKLFFSVATVRWGR
ncbi:MAG: hypothetical protein KAW17_09765 [Candidatus Eisenbacteria sp.]|nr:hypothetical protein [Candidatus Eisenbacteria bacterium]